jgi:hypothetical protein
MRRHVLSESINGGEMTLTEGDASEPRDALGCPMRKLTEFTAATWDVAKQLRSDHLGWGP